VRHWVVLAAVLAVGCGAPGEPDPGGPPDPPSGCEDGAPVGLELGQCAPEFILPDSEGSEVALSSFRGSVALVDIAALW
jgi:hypothetical protein